MKEEVFQEINNMDFEDAFDALQENVAKLESEELSLDKSLMLFKRGQVLAKHCANLLEKAELQVRSLDNDTSVSMESEE